MVNNRFGRKWVSAALIATGALAAVALPQTSSASVGIYAQFAAPVQYVDSYPAHRHGYTWVPGYWERRGYHQVWIEGTWVREHYAHYAPQHRFEQRYYDGYRGYGGNQHRARWDSDGDGIPDRYDRHPYNPYRR